MGLVIGTDGCDHAVAQTFPECFAIGPRAQWRAQMALGGEALHRRVGEVQLMRGELGFPADGFPAELQKKVLRDQAPMTGRPGEHLPPVDLEAAREQAQKLVGHAVNDQELASYLMYPKVYQTYCRQRSQYGDVSVIPTPAYFYGLQDHEEIAVTIDQGKTLHLRIEGRTPADDEGRCRLFFELNGQPRMMRVALLGAAVNAKALRQAEEGNPAQVAAPMPGTVARVAVKEGQRVLKGDVLASIEAMKMESLVCAEMDGVVKHIHAKHGDSVPAKALLMELQA